MPIHFRHEQDLTIVDGDLCCFRKNILHIGIKAHRSSRIPMRRICRRFRWVLLFRHIRSTSRHERETLEYKNADQRNKSIHALRWICPCRTLEIGLAALRPASVRANQSNIFRFRPRATGVLVRSLRGRWHSSAGQMRNPGARGSPGLSGCAHVPWFRRPRR